MTNTHTEVQVIRDESGNPAYVVIPYQQWLAKENRDQGAVPHTVVNLVFDNDWSPVRAWREYLGFTQAEVAARLGVSQSAFAQTERAQRPRKTTLVRVAKALGLSIEQLDF